MHSQYFYTAVVVVFFQDSISFKIKKKKKSILLKNLCVDTWAGGVEMSYLFKDTPSPPTDKDTRVPHSDCDQNIHDITFHSAKKRVLVCFYFKRDLKDILFYVIIFILG